MNKELKSVLVIETVNGYRTIETEIELEEGKKIMLEGLQNNTLFLHVDFDDGGFILVYKKHIISISLKKYGEN